MSTSISQSVPNFPVVNSYSLSLDLTEQLAKSVDTSFIPVAQYPELVIDWKALAKKINNTNSFLERYWLEAWLTELADTNTLAVKMVDQQNGELVGLGFLGSSICKRRKFFTVKQYTLNSSTAENRNMVIEYNQLLCAPERFTELHQQFIVAVFQHLLKAGEELHLPFSVIKNINCLSGKNSQLPATTVELEQSLTAWQVVKQGKEPFLSSAYLSANRRHQIRRAIRLYEQRFQNPLQVIQPVSVDEALQFFDKLGELHTRYWQSKGLPGSFANPIWVAFHRRLIESGFSNGRVQLLKFCAGSRVVGYLYNHVHGDWVGNIQSGFDYSIDDKRLKPGFVCHTMAIQLNFDSGRRYYDMLAGDGEQKSSLANAQSELHSWVIQRSSVGRRIENSLLKLIRGVREYV